MADQEKLEQDINDIKNAINSITSNVRRIERALARDTYIPAVWHSIRYSRKDKQLIFDKRFRMQFDKNEAALLEIMFNAKSGVPKKQKFYCAEVAEHFHKLGNSPQTAKAVHQTITRIDSKVRQQTHLEAFHITTKEFYNLTS